MHLVVNHLLLIFIILEIDFLTLFHFSHLPTYYYQILNIQLIIPCAFSLIREFRLFQKIIIVINFNFNSYFTLMLNH